MRRLLLTTLLLSGPALLTSPSAVAQESGEDEDPSLNRAKQLFANGSRLYDEGQYAEAALAFEESYKLSNAPPLLFNAANAYERMGDLETSIRFLNKYRVYADPSEQDALTRRVSNLEKRMAAEAATAAPPSPPMETKPAPTVATVASSPDAESTGAPSKAKIAGGTLVGVGGLAAIVGGTIAGFTFSEGNRLIEDSAQAENDAAYQDLKSDYEALLPLNQRMVVVTGVGVGAAVIGVALLAAGGGASAADRSPVVPTVSADVSRAGAHANLAWTF